MCYEHPQINFLTCCYMLFYIFYMLLKSNHSEVTWEKKAFDLKLTELLTILFVLISYITNKYKLNNVVTYLSISLY